MKTIKLSLLRLAAGARRLLTLLENEAKPEANDYETWQHQFMEKRLRLGLWLALFIFLSFSVLELVDFIFASHTASGYWLLSDTAIEIIILICLTLLSTPLGRRYQGVLFLIFSLSIPIILDISQLLQGIVNLDLFTWMMTFFTMATLIPVRWRLHFASQFGTFFYSFAVNLAMGIDGISGENLPGEVALKLFWICLVCNLSVYLYERLAKAEFRARQNLQVEQERAERLLLNILPQPIAERLKKESRTIAEASEEVTVLFADIVGFTQLASRISPTELVNLLNQIFSRFDQLAEQHGVEKIKTIGDAYMLVAGLPEHRSDHAQAIADMALDMQQAIVKFNEQTGYSLNIRIGIASGSVVAGVIGLKKFAYDLWGDTVNTASRMESHGIPGSIQVTCTTYECLKHQYLFEERGLISIKGKGEMTTYLLKEKHKTTAERAKAI